MLTKTMTLLGTLITLNQAVDAQRLQTPFGNSQNGRLAALSARTRFQPPAAILRQTPDHRWEGVIIGAVLVGAGGALLANGFCDYGGTQEPNCFGRTVVGGAIGAAVGAVAGGLIGGLIPKRASSQEAGP